MKKHLDKLLSQEEVEKLEQSISKIRFEDVTNHLELDRIKKYLQYCVYYSKYRQASNLIQHALKDYGSETWFKYYDLLIFIQKDPLNPLSHPKVFMDKVNALVNDNFNLDTLKNFLYLSLYEALAKAKMNIYPIPESDYISSFNEISSYLKSINIHLEHSLMDLKSAFADLSGLKETTSDLISESVMGYTIPDREANEESKTDELSPDELRDKIALLEGQLKYCKDKLSAIATPVSKELSSEEYDFYDTRILVIGDSQVKENDLSGIFKVEGFNKNNIDLQLDYAKLPQFNISEIQYSDKYDCILVGPVPHKMRGIGSYSSLLELLKNEEGYPYTIKIQTQNDELKITKSGLKKAIKSVKAFLISNRGNIQ